MSQGQKERKKQEKKEAGKERSMNFTSAEKVHFLTVNVVGDSCNRAFFEYFQVTFLIVDPISQSHSVIIIKKPNCLLASPFLSFFLFALRHRIFRW